MVENELYQDRFDPKEYQTLDRLLAQEGIKVGGIKFDFLTTPREDASRFQKAVHLKGHFTEAGINLLLRKMSPFIDLQSEVQSGKDFYRIFRDSLAQKLIEFYDENEYFNQETFDTLAERTWNEVIRDPLVATAGQRIEESEGISRLVRGVRATYQGASPRTQNFFQGLVAAIMAQDPEDPSYEAVSK